jgi:hypothetical protein
MYKITRRTITKWELIRRIGVCQSHDRSGGAGWLRHSWPATECSSLGIITWRGSPWAADGGASGNAMLGSGNPTAAQSLDRLCDQLAGGM